jgi:hypothetical protein
MSDTETDSIISSYSDVQIQRGAPTEFSKVVGMDVFRAKCIIEPYGYYCVIKEFPAIKKKVKTDTHPKRVILYLDKDGYVGTTPRAG